MALSKARARATEKGLSPNEFRRRIIANPEDHIRRFLGQETWGDLGLPETESGLRGQLGVIHSVLNHRRTSVSGCVGSTKTFAAALAVVCFMHAYAPAEIYTTAPTFRQVKKVLWKEIRKIVKRSSVPLGGKLLDTEWKIDDDWFAMGFSPKDPDAVHGTHAKNILVVLDEAQGIEQEVIEGLENIMAGGNSRMLLLFNPNAVAGQEAYECAHSKRALYNHITIDAFSTPNVRLGRTVIPGAIERPQVVQWIKTFGKNSNFVRVKVFAKYPKQAEDSVIPMDWIEMAMRRDKPDIEGIDAFKALDLLPTRARIRGDQEEYEEEVEREEEAARAAAPQEPEDGAPPEAQAGVQPKGDRRGMGVDVARFGDDSTCMFMVVRNLVLPAHIVKGKDNAQVCGMVRRGINIFRPGKAFVDEIGTGTGVVDMARDARIRQVHGVNVAEKAKNSKEFDDLRSELWWAVREALDPEGDDPLVLPYDLDLLAELSTVSYSMTRKGKIRVESKEEVRKRLKRSTDRADALYLALYATASSSFIPSAAANPKSTAAISRERGLLNERPRGTLGPGRERLKRRFGLT